MKKVWGLFIGMSMISFFAHSQTLIENSRPQSEDAGRILALEELMRITDEGEEFYFKRPFQLSLDDEGFIYFQDGEFFLKFTPQGTFVGDLAHLGQGPGEVQSLRYKIQGETINVWDTRARKVVFYDLDGRFLEEFKPEQQFGMRMVGHYGDSLIFSTYNMPRQEEMKGMIDVDHRILLISKDTGADREVQAFPIPWHVTPTSGTSYAPFLVLPNDDGSTLFINDSPEYRIKVVDTSTGDVLRIFTRKYKRVRAPERPPRPGDTRPERKYVYDITYMVMNKDQIWVWTSTADEEKGVLFDVFSPAGHYLDSFYIPNEVGFMHARGDILFARSQDEDGNFAVVKYRILNGPQIPVIDK